MDHIEKVGNEFTVHRSSRFAALAMRQAVLGSRGEAAEASLWALRSYRATWAEPPAYVRKRGRRRRPDSDGDQGRPSVESRESTQTNLKK